jgi:lysophospholipase L1-like esterase
MRYLALGDSYTVGEGAGERASFADQIEEGRRSTVNGQRKPVDRRPSTVDRIATTGWTTGELLAAIRAAPPTGVYDLVSLCIGVNNQYRGLPIEEYRREFSELLALAIGFAGGAPRQVVVLSIPDWGVTPFAEGRDRAAIGEAIDAFNRAAKAETRQRGAHWVDVTGDSRRHPDDVVEDGLHPSAQAYARWARLVADQLQP